jgi:hypothetical protein
MAHTVCGWYEGIPSYYNNVSNSFQNTVNTVNTKYGNIYTGDKWQCVEFIRRYLVLRHGITFDSVKNVYELKNLSQFYSLISQSPVPVRLHTYGLPMKNDILILSWKDTGHVAIVAGIDRNKGLIYAVDQNGEPEQWEHERYSRAYSIYSKEIMGWLRYQLPQLE